MDMSIAITDYCRRTRQPEPTTKGQFIRCVLESLAAKAGAKSEELITNPNERLEAPPEWVEQAKVAGETLPPAPVEAASSASELTSSWLRELEKEESLDLIILARGGGSIEDLWAFNDERVARAIADSTAPIITGIGHETDFTLADFAADVRAATPTAAAEQAVPDRAELREQFLTVASLLESAWQQRYNLERNLLQDTGRRLELQSPSWRVRNDRQRLDDLQSQLGRNERHRLEIQRGNTLSLHKRLASLSPQAVLQRGYAIVRTSEGELVKSVRQVQKNDMLDIHVSDGVILARTLTDPTKNNNGGNSDD